MNRFSFIYVQLDDQLTIRTPEGVELNLTLAGLASRVLASLLDGLIQLIAGGVIVVALVVIFDGGLETLGSGLLALALFLIFFGYPILFEVLDGGRSIGKRATGLRVVRLDGGPIGFGAAAIRNIMRLIDILPGGYAVGAITILATPHNQRLGDMAAGTVVIRERTIQVAPVAQSAPIPTSYGRLDVTAVSADEIALIRRYFERREALPEGRRMELAWDIARRIKAKVALPGELVDPEGFLARILTDKGR
jgi:uncharacterized RDD family membrane protein YckC